MLLCLQKCGGVCTQQCYTDRVATHVLHVFALTCVMHTIITEAVYTDKVATHAVSYRTPDSNNSQCVADYNSNSVGYNESHSILLEYNLLY